MASILTEQELQRVIDSVWDETLDRKKGSFKRALWYGNNSRIVGQNKGVRKLVRNTPRKLLNFGIGKIPVLGDALSIVSDTALDLGKNIYSDHIKPRIRVKPQTTAEKARKNVKKEIKDLKNNAVAVIDRNLVKLRDARAGIQPKLNDFMGSVNDPLEVRTEKAEKLIRQIFEAHYYETKVLGLTTKLREATVRVDEDLKRLNGETLQLYWEVTDMLLTDFE